VGNFFGAKKIKLGVKMMEIFGRGLLILMPVGTKQVLSAGRLFLYERASRS
jgi:hypothetical protein